MSRPRCYCKKKRRFRDKREAVRTLHYIQNADERETTPVRVYQCRVCQGWFLTSKPQYGEETVKEILSK